MSMLMFAFVGIAWGLMPVNPGRFRWGRRGRIVVSGAGPAMNLLLAFVTLTVLALWLTFAAPAAGSTPPPLYHNLAVFLFTGGWLNIVLAIFNMLPIPPLDGASVLSGLSLRAYQFFQKPEAVMFGMFVVLAVMFSAIGEVFFRAIEQWSMAYVAMLVDLLGGASVRPAPV
jgi:Zn-dependent protease